jgi:radical SAM enzyme (TIGR01210 family)
MSLDAWILERRPARNAADAFRPYAFFTESERANDGEIVPVSTVFLTNRECPWRCLMCDLRKNTLEETVPLGTIPGQIEYALGRLPPARHIKLYNSGSFFDPRAIPPTDYCAIAAQLGSFTRVIVESHPALIESACLRFREMLSGRLEVAMGLETVHPDALPRLNKRMTLEDFSAAAGFLRSNDIDLRVFILVQPPFVPEEEASYWAERSLDFAFECGAAVATLIPTRGGNGAMEEIDGFEAPRISTLESCLEYGVSIGKGRVFADLWDLERFSRCRDCYPSRADRLQHMNLHQTIPKRTYCSVCGVTE